MRVDQIKSWHGPRDCREKSLRRFAATSSITLGTFKGGWFSMPRITTGPAGGSKKPVLRERR